MSFKIKTTLTNTVQLNEEEEEEEETPALSRRRKGEGKEPADFLSAYIKEKCSSITPTYKLYLDKESAGDGYPY